MKITHYVEGCLFFVTDEIPTKFFKKNQKVGEE